MVRIRRPGAKLSDSESKSLSVLISLEICRLEKLLGSKGKLPSSDTDKSELAPANHKISEQLARGEFIQSRFRMQTMVKWTSALAYDKDKTLLLANWLGTK